VNPGLFTIDQKDLTYQVPVIDMDHVIENHSANRS